MGGNTHQCDACGAIVYSYHSCNNRSCPTCGHRETERWLEKQRKRILDTHYFHTVVTLPHELNDLVRSNQRTMYSLLLNTAFQAVKKVIQKKVCGNALVGAIAVLHTWSRALIGHNHVHLLIPGSGIDKQCNLWHTKRDTFLVPEKAVATVFRALFIKRVRKAFPNVQIPQSLFRKNWVVRILPTLSHKKQVLIYLSRYIKRTAITNKRILAVEKGTVTFRYLDNNTRKYRVINLPVLEFMRRFLQHVLPKGFPKIRHYGLLHHTHNHLFSLVKKELQDNTLSQEEQKETADKTLQTKPGNSQCPHCKKGALVIIDKIKRKQRAPPW